MTINCKSCNEELNVLNIDTKNVVCETCLTANNIPIINKDLMIEIINRYAYIEIQVAQYSESENYIYNDYEIAKRNTIYESLKKEKIWLQKIIDKFNFETDICEN